MKCPFIWSDDEDDDSSSDSEPDPKRVAISPVSEPHFRLPRGGDSFLDFCDHPGTAVVDKTRCILELPDKFRCLLLRPPRFGKTAFLSTLSHYCDIHGARHFSRQHFAFPLALSGIRLRSDMDFITSELKFNSSLALRGLPSEWQTIRFWV
ncbi:hypothetical protein B0H17DRAFT_231615 [Mycena rosella]|uniref:AAA-ATPase-like domain-containing protein n=1 Tax=Mycena rosella TaxID=1033263 RepID=A0AAD7H0Q4_MYCRO|nr:hypothetical protein B0H17DRAFT_231615 [Mycena rosella]